MYFFRSLRKHKELRWTQDMFIGYCMTLKSCFNVLISTITHDPILPRSLWDWVNCTLELLTRSQFKAYPFKMCNVSSGSPSAGCSRGTSFSALQAIAYEVIVPAQVVLWFWHYYRHWNTSLEICQEHPWKSRTKESVKTAFREKILPRRRGSPDWFFFIL